MPRSEATFLTKSKEQARAEMAAFCHRAWMADSPSASHPDLVLFFLFRGADVSAWSYPKDIRVHPAL